MATISNHDVFLVTEHEPCVWEWHYHSDTDEVLMVLEGELKIEFLNGQSFVLGPFDLLNTPKGMVHRTISITPTKNLRFTHINDNVVVFNSDYSDKVSRITKFNFKNWHKKHSASSPLKELVYKINDYCIRFCIITKDYNPEYYSNSETLFFLMENEMNLNIDNIKNTLNPLQMVIIPQNSFYSPNTSKNNTGLILFEKQ